MDDVLGHERVLLEEHYLRVALARGPLGPGEGEVGEGAVEELLCVGVEELEAEVGGDVGGWHGGYSWES